MYNHKKLQKKADFSWNKHYEQMLRENDKDHGQPIRDASGITDWQLQQHGHKEQDSSSHYNKQLGEERKGTNEAVVEKAFDKNPKLYNLHRNDKAWDSKVTAVDRMDEAYYQEKMKAWSEAQKGQDWDTSFWDKYVGNQMQGPTTKITDNVQKSQLQNHPDRFVGLDKEMPIMDRYQDSEKVWGKAEDFYKMVEASLKNSDAILFTIHAKAAIEDRELTEKEQQMVTDVNSAKVRLLAALDNKVPAKYAQVILKSAQFDDFYEPYENDLETWETDRVYEDMAAEREDAAREDAERDMQNQGPDRTIEPEYDNGHIIGYNVYEHGEYEQSSVLAGQPKRTFVDGFNSLDEAKKAYPDAQVLEHSTKTDIRMPDVDPRPDLTREFGETYHEDDY